MNPHSGSRSPGKEVCRKAGCTTFVGCLALTLITKAIVSSAPLGSLGQRFAEPAFTLGSEILRSLLYSGGLKPTCLRVRAYWGSNHTLQIGRPFDQKRRWYCPFMLQKNDLRAWQKKDLYISGSLHNIPSLFLPSFSYKINMGRVVQQIPVSTLTPASPPICLDRYPCFSIMILCLLVVSVFLHSSFAVFILLSYWLWSPFPNSSTTIRLPGGHCNCRTGGREVGTCSCFPSQTLASLTEGMVKRLWPKLKCRSLEGGCPSSFREPNSGYQRYQQECPCYKFQLHLIQDGLSKFHPLEALNFIC